VGREFRFRVRQALAEQEIDIGTPTYALTSGPENGNGHLPEAKVP
jgi:hypothetical protein